MASVRRYEQGRAYRLLRRRKHLTQAQLAARLGVTPQMVSQIEQGRRGVPGGEDRDGVPTGGLDRFDYDATLALGEEDAGDELLYALGSIEYRREDIRVSDPPCVFASADDADAAASA